MPTAVWKTKRLLMAGALGAVEGGACADGETKVEVDEEDESWGPDMSAPGKSLC
jgi:hypothetical protein